MTTFFLVMTLHPQVQQRAQAEIERVVGKDRLPNLNDQKDLPYVAAVIKEVLRWAPIVPLGIAGSLDI
jgi:cytochrome P450